MSQSPTIGQIVHYHPTADTAFPAIINTVEEGTTVSLNVFTPGGTESVQGVAHASAPSTGCWNWPPTSLGGVSVVTK